MQRRIDIYLWTWIVLMFVGSIIAAIEITLLDAQSLANSRPPELRPTRDVGEFEIMMSRHRREPYAPTLSAYILMAFLITSQLMVLRYLPKPTMRWMCFSTVTLMGIVWTWYQITPWLFDGECSVWAKVIGEPFYYVLIPYIVFTFLVNSQAKWTPFKTISMATGQIIAHLAWLWIWAFTQLFLGWYWI